LKIPAIDIFSKISIPKLFTRGGKSMSFAPVGDLIRTADFKNVELDLSDLAVPISIWALSEV
jgi:hypothetical protein